MILVLWKSLIDTSNKVFLKHLPDFIFGYSDDVFNGRQVKLYLRRNETLGQPKNRSNDALDHLFQYFMNQTKKTLKVCPKTPVFSPNELSMA